MTAAELEKALPLLKKIPYSLHSSFSELECFVAHLKPYAIVPIVKKCYNPRCPIDPAKHFKHLLGKPIKQLRQQPDQQLAQQSRLVTGLAMKRKAGTAGTCSEQMTEGAQTAQLESHGSWQVG